MKAPVVDQAEAARFSLRLACEDCCHFGVAESGEPRCGNGWPTDEHRARATSFVFCKEFEMA